MAQGLTTVRKASRKRVCRWKLMNNPNSSDFGKRWVTDYTTDSHSVPTERMQTRFSSCYCHTTLYTTVSPPLVLTYCALVNLYLITTIFLIFHIEKSLCVLWNKKQTCIFKRVERLNREMFEPKKKYSIEYWKPSQNLPKFTFFHSISNILNHC